MQPVRYMVANGLTEFRPDSVYSDVSPYSAMEGASLNSDDEFPKSDEMFLEFSNASGRRKRRKGKTSSRRDERKSKRAERVAKRTDRKDQRADRKDRKLAIKEKEADTQSKVAQGIAETSPEEALLMQKLASGDQSSQNNTSNNGQGMSKGLKIGLILGGVAIFGVITILVIRKMRKK